MELEGSSPHSQVPGICPYPESDRYSPYPHNPVPEPKCLLIPWLLS